MHILVALSASHHNPYTRTRWVKGLRWVVARASLRNQFKKSPKAFFRQHGGIAGLNKLRKQKRLYRRRKRSVP
jgi:hypothetical protein